VRGAPKAPNAAQLRTALKTCQDFAEEEWVSCTTLHRLAGLPERMFRKCVEHLVAMGHPIVSDNQRGYRYAYGDPEALAEAARKLRGTARSLLRRAQHLEESATKAAQANRGQSELGLDFSESMA
jgi:biotin operon repressor